MRPEIESLRESIAAEWSAVETSLTDLEHVNTGQPSPLDVRAAASILHDFYSGVKAILTRVATTIDKDPRAVHRVLDSVSQYSLLADGCSLQTD